MSIKRMNKTKEVKKIKSLKQANVVLKMPYVLNCMKLFLFVLLSFNILSCNPKEPSKPKESGKPQEQKENEAVKGEFLKLKQSLSEKISKHNADIDWEKKLKDKYFDIHDIYTVDVEDVFIGTNGRPICFITDEIEDIYKKNEKYYIRYKNYSVVGDIKVVTECTQEQMLIIKNSPKNKFAIIVQIFSVTQPELYFTAKGGDESDDAYIQIDSNSVFIARGRLIDLLDMKDFRSASISDFLKGEFYVPNKRANNLTASTLSSRT